MKRYSMLLLALLLITTLAPHAAHAAPLRCFPGVAGIDNCISGQIQAFWERNGGLPVFGYPLTPAVEQQDAQGLLIKQVFERARLEVHPQNPALYRVQLGRLGADTLARRSEPAATADTPRAGCRFFAETQQNVCAPFLASWRRYGLDLGQPGITEAESLALFGLPLGPAHPEQMRDGQTRSVQWFERARFEDHGADGVLFGLLGREVAETPAPSTIALPTVARGGFVQVQGTQLVLQGQPIQLKGINYYPQGRPWAEMWQAWSGLQAERELRQARDQLGINTVRVLLPYDTGLPNQVAGQLTPGLLQSLRELVQVAGSLDMRVIVALFDFDDGFPPPGSVDEQRNLAYLETLLGNFAGDDRIIAWDLHNEPDHYDTWKNGESGRALLWLGRMADAIHRLAPNHLVTVGMGVYDNFWQAGLDGRRPVDYIDFVSLHNYNAADTARQIAELRNYTPKPIVLGEFGWPTGPACAIAGYTEQQQEFVYRETLRQANGQLAGVVAWTLRDFDPAQTTRWESREEHYGLYRVDGSLKPAAAILRDYPARPLPSNVATQLQLSEIEPNYPGDGNAPLLIAVTNHYVKGPFRRAWELLGGQSSFGAPIAEAFFRESPRGLQVVQYFDAATLVIPVGFHIPSSLPHQDQIDMLRQQMQLEPLGAYYAGPVAANGQAEAFGPGQHRIGSVFNAFYRTYRGQWRLGAAISEPLTETVNGSPTLVQYYQFGRLELNPASGSVEASRFGQRAYTDLCRANGQ